MLEIKNLNKKYSRGGKEFSALSDVSLSAGAGDFIGISGPSGSGKSTLFHIVSGLLKPDCGTVKIAGADISAMSERELAILRRSDVGCILQGENLLSNFTVAENISLPLWLGHEKCGRERVSELLSAFGLSGMEDSYPSSLSGGEQRRVSIIRGFIHSPKLVIADEPTNSLDPENAAVIMAFFKKMADERKVTLLISSHDSDMLCFASKRYVMSRGKLSEFKV